MPTIQPPAILMMKAGFHGDEGLSDIIGRKRAEEALLGYTYWGYGGTLCHPLNVVQSFAKEAAARGNTVDVLFVATESPHIADPVCAGEYSADGISWHGLPQGARVTASKSALVLRNLRPCMESLPLGGYRVAAGPSAGKSLSEYFRMRTDKATAFLGPLPDRERGPVVTVAFRAELAGHGAVFLRE
jgi:hypothetical protein